MRVTMTRLCPNCECVGMRNCQVDMLFSAFTAVLGISARLVFWLLIPNQCAIREL